MNKKRVAKIGLIGILFICVFLGIFTIKKQNARAGSGKEVSNLKVVDVTTNSFKLTWDETSGEGRYRIYLYDGSFVYNLVTSTDSTEYKVNNVAPGTYRKYAVVKDTIDWSFLSGMEVNSPIEVITKPEKVYNFRCTEAFHNSVKLKWDGVRNATGYRIYRYNVKDDSYKVEKDTNNTEVVVDNLSSQTTYTFAIAAYVSKNGITSFGARNGDIKVRTYPSPITDLQQVENNSEDSITIKWYNPNDVDVIFVYAYLDEEWRLLRKLYNEERKYTIEDLEPGTNLWVKVKNVVYKKDGSFVMDNNNNSKQFITAPRVISNLWVDNNSITDENVTLRWKKSKGATGYGIYSYNKNNDCYELLKDVGNVDSCSMNNLKGNTSYSFRVKAYKEHPVTKHHYSSNEKAPSVKVRTKLGYPNNLRLTGMSKRSVRFDWDSVYGAEGYIVKILDLNGNLIQESKTSNTYFSYKENKESKINVKIVVQAYAGNVKGYRTIAQTGNNNLQPPKNLRVVGREKNGFNIEWDGVVGAKKYYIHEIKNDSNGKKTYYRMANPIGGTGCNICNMEDGGTITIVVTSYSEDDGEGIESVYSEECSCMTKYAAPNLSTTYMIDSNNNGYVNISWSKVKGAEQHVIYKYNYQKRCYEEYKVLDSNTTTYNDYNVKRSNDRYWYAVCGRGKFNNKVYDGIWSNYSSAIIGNYGITVSDIHGQIDWNKVKNDAPTYAIIRALKVINKKAGEVGEQETELIEDRCFEYNIKEAINQRMRVGVYIECNADDEEEARREAAYVVDYVKGYTLDFPIYYDIQNKSKANIFNKKKNTAIALAFCEEVKRLGHTAGIYSTAKFLDKYLEVGKFRKYEIYASRYYNKREYSLDTTLTDINYVIDKTFNFGNKYKNIYPTMWEYTKKGVVKGINGYVCMTTR